MGSYTRLRSRLINKWMGDAQMATATDDIRDKYIFMLNCMSDIELARPYILMDSIKGMSLKELSIKYETTVETVRWQIRRVVKQHELLKTDISLDIKS